MALWSCGLVGLVQYCTILHKVLTSPTRNFLLCWWTLSDKEIESLTTDKLFNYVEDWSEGVPCKIYWINEEKNDMLYWTMLVRPWTRGNHSWRCFTSSYSGLPLQSPYNFFLTSCSESVCTSSIWTTLSLIGNDNSSEPILRAWHLLRWMRIGKARKKHVVSSTSGSNASMHSLLAGKPAYLE